MANKSKAKLIKELQDYNKILGKHMPSVDFEKAIELKGALESSKDDEYYSLLATNFVELRTEVALLRKNLSNDIEAMVLKQVTEMQTKFFKQLTDFSAKIVFDIKENSNNYIQELNNNVLDIKREFNKISTKNELIENRFEELRNNSLDFKAYVDKLEHSQNNAFRQLNGEVEKIHMQNSTSFAKVVDRLNSEIRTSRDAFRKLGTEVSQSHTHIKKEIGTIKEMKEKPIFIDAKTVPPLKEKSKDPLDSEEFKIENFDNAIEPNIQEKSILEEENIFDNPEENLFKEKNNKLLEIDKRIKNLQNLK